MEEKQSELTIIEQKCHEANLKLRKDNEQGIILIDHLIDRNTIKPLEILLPTGEIHGSSSLIREQIDQTIIKMLAENPFEKFKSLSTYSAIWSKELGIIEAKIYTNYSGPISWLLGFPRPKDADSAENPDRTRIVFKSNSDNFSDIKISLGMTSETFAVLKYLLQPVKQAGRVSRDSQFIQTIRIRMNKGQTHDNHKEAIKKYLTQRSASIIIEGVYLNNHNHACQILEHIANALFFQLDIPNLAIYLAPEEEKGRGLVRDFPTDRMFLKFPEYQYETKPMSLYWYANTVQELPLLQYLAYYQVIEFFFPRYMAEAARDVIKRLIKDPSFGNNIEENIDKLFAIVRPFVSRGVYSNEREALTATMRSAVSSKEIEDFIEAKAERKEFFGNRKDTWEEIVKQSIYSGNSKDGTDILSSTAERIYRIRCKIVHTKSSDINNDDELLLPFSKEVQKLQHDIDLIRFIAKKVLIASGKPLSLQ